MRPLNAGKKIGMVSNVMFSNYFFIFFNFTKYWQKPAMVATSIFHVDQSILDTHRFSIFSIEISNCLTDLLIDYRHRTWEFRKYRFHRTMETELSISILGKNTKCPPLKFEGYWHSWWFDSSFNLICGIFLALNTCLAASGQNQIFSNQYSRNFLVFLTRHATKIFHHLSQTHNAAAPPRVFSCRILRSKHDVIFNQRKCTTENTILKFMHL